MIKPDGVQRGLIGRIISRFEDKGLQLVGLKMLLAEETVLDEHYADLKVNCAAYSSTPLNNNCRTVHSILDCWST